MGMVKQMGAEAVTFSPEIIERVQRRVCYHICKLGGLSPAEAQRIFEESIAATNLRRRPGPVVHEDPEYLAEVILEQAGIPLLDKER